MCGFFGVIGDICPSLLKGALFALEHRGPDHLGFVDLKKTVNIGHSRLSILDLSDHANQPFTSSCGRYTIVYNGEVYNYRELASEHNLSKPTTTSDTEVVVELFAKLGNESFELLNGMFALAIYDSHDRKLFLARDRLGIKPLFITQNDASISFASEIKALEVLNDLDPHVNVSALHEWTYYGNTLGNKTLRQGVSRVIPGTFLEIDCTAQKIETHRYWSIRSVLDKPRAKLSVDVAASDVRKLLKSAVERQLVSDVPVGVFLSGGIDSSAITAFAGQALGTNLSTYSVKFDYDKGVNELPKAKMVAEMYGTDHHEFEIGGYDVADTVVKMVHHHDHPFSDAANIPLYLLSKKVRDKTKVILQGDGGDELFAGYQRYNTLAHINRMRLLANVGRFVNYFTPRNVGYYARQRYINALKSEPDYRLMAALLTVEDENSPPTQIFTSDFRRRVEAFPHNARYKDVEAQYQDQNLVNRMLLVDTEIILPDIFLEKVDRSTMAASVEVRVPFLDNDLLEYCLSLPSSLKVQKGQQKYLLKKALDGIVPNEILYGPKTGFGVPFGYWLKGPLKDLLFDQLSDFQKTNPNVLDSDELSRMHCAYSSGERDFGFLLWKVLNLVLWTNSKNISFR